jgi:hypothetical protein
MTFSKLYCRNTPIGNVSVTLRVRTDPLLGWLITAAALCATALVDGSSLLGPEKNTHNHVVILSAVVAVIAMSIMQKASLKYHQKLSSVTQIIPEAVWTTTQVED